jgi:hypothetical protein
MNYWHMTLESTDNQLGHEKIKKILQQNLIGMGIWDEKYSTQQIDFQKKMDIGDIVLIKSKEASIALVKVVSDYFEDDKNSDLIWFTRKRKIEILEILNEVKYDFPEPLGTLKVASNKNTDSYQYIDNWYKLINNNI